MSEAALRPLRFGVMCEGTTFPTWQARCLQDLLAVDGVELALLIVDATERAPDGRLAKARARMKRGDLAWTLYNRTAVARRARASRPVDLAPLLSRVPAIRCKVTKQGRWSEYFAEQDLETVRAAALDFILRFGFGIIRGEILESARYGVWSFHHDDVDRIRGGPPCFWEIYDGDAVTGAVLQRLTDRLDGGIILARGWFRTVHHSYARNRDAAYFGSADWPAQVCRRILGGDDAFLDAPATASTAPVRHNPGARQTARFLLRLAFNFLAAQHRGLARRDQWNIGIADRPIATFLDDPGLGAVRWGPSPPSGKYLADPFGVQEQGGVTVVAEAFDHRSGRGTITTVRLTEDESDASGATVLPAAVHASYPFLFESGGVRYCVPETALVRQVVLHRAVRFPDRWEPVAVLIDDFAGLDPTITRYEGRWWLFCTDLDRGPDTKLHIWYADQVEGPWTAHPANPVKCDVRSARPAGTPFVHGGALYRPAQDASRTYGGAVRINRIIRLTPTAFEEEPAVTIEPDPTGPYPHGTHTLSAAGCITLVDAKREVFQWAAFGRELRARLRRLRTGRG